MSELSGLSAAAESVIQRWYPDGMTRLRTAAAADLAHRAVAVVGPDKVGKSAVVTELTEFLPGVEFTLSTAEAAVALVLLDSGAPVGRDALGVVDEVLANGNRIVFALNKIDAHSDWREVQARDLDLLARHVDRLSGTRIWPVSARLSRFARTGPDAGSVLATSGIVDLAHAIDAELSIDPAQLRAQTLANATYGVVERTRDRIAAKADSLRRADDAADLRAERARLVAERGAGRTELAAALRSQVQLARVELQHEVGNRVRVLNTHARNEIDGLGRGSLPGFPHRLAENVADLTAALDERTRKRLGELRRRVLGSDSDPIPFRAGGPPPGVGEEPEARRRGIEDRLMIAVGASAGVGLGRLAVAPLSMVPALDYATIPVALLLGALAAWWFTRARRHLADRAHLRQWTAETLVHVRSDLEQRVHAAVVGAEEELTERAIRHQTDRALAIDDQIAVVDADLRHLAARRSGQLAACDRDLATLAAAVARP